MNYWNINTAENLKGYELKTFLNKMRIIKSLYLNGELSVVDFSESLHVSTPTVINYINELVEEGFVEKRGKGNSSGGGRKPNRYGLKKNSVYLVGIAVGRRFLRIAIFNPAMEKVAGINLCAVSFSDREHFISTITEQVNALLADAKIKLEKVMGIGINMPGLINSDKGINYTYLYNEDEPLTDSFRKQFGCSVFLENDTKARAIAEMRYGAAKEAKNVLVIQIDWGLGLGMILNGNLYKGNSGFAGEFSHIPIEENGVLCNCGKVGCLETIASGNALVRNVLQGLENNRQSMLYPAMLDNKENITPGLIIKMALCGDQFAISKIEEVGLALGKGIVYLIQILNPELVILGGKVSEAGEYLITPIKQTLNKYCLSNVREDADITISSLGEDAGTIGSATLVLENIIINN